MYTGQDTKLGLNSLLTGIKFSTVEKSMNIFLLAFLVLLILEVGLCTLQKYLYLPYLSKYATIIAQITLLVSNNV